MARYMVAARPPANLRMGSGKHLSAVGVHDQRAIPRRTFPALYRDIDALADDSIRKVTVIAPVRDGKSLIADIWVPSLIVREPGPCMWNFQSDPIAKDYAEARIHPVLRNSPAVQTLWPDDRHLASTQRVIFRNGMPLYIQGPSIGNLQTKGIRYLINDEGWLYGERLGEAEGRLGDFEKIGTSKQLNISQASTVGDPLCIRFEEGSRHERYIHCLSCGHYQKPVFSGFRPDGSRHGIVFDIPNRDKNDNRPKSELLGQILPTVRWECEKCGQAATDSGKLKSEWNRLGKYVAENPSAPVEIKSYRWSGVITKPWVQLVKLFINAQDAYAVGSVEPLMEFTQKFLAEFWSDAAQFVADPFKKEAYEVLSKRMEGEDWRFLTLDRQAEGLMYAVARAWSRQWGCRRLWRGKLYSEAEVEAKRKELDILPSSVLIDSGFEARFVYGMCVRNGWTALKGEDDKFFLHPVKNSEGRVTGYVRKSTAVPAMGDPEMGTTKQGKGKRAPLIRWSNPAIFDRLKRLIDGRGLPFVNPVDVDDPDEEAEYQRQMRARYKIRKRHPITGKVEEIWVCPTGNDHYADCEAQQVVGATLINEKFPGLMPDEIQVVETKEEKESV
jgi:hypothetical protein